MNTRKNVRVRTPRIVARAIDNRLTYTTHWINRVTRYPLGTSAYEYGSLDVNPDGVRLYF